MSMFLPRLPRISRAFSGVFSKGTIWNLMSGHVSLTFAQSFMSSCAGVMGDEPTRMTLVSSSMAFFARVTESRQYWMMYFAS